MAENVTRVKPLRVGVIGLGVGAQHAAAYAKNPDCRLAMLCDQSPRQLNAVRSQYPDAEVTANADAVLTHPAIDVVSIATFDDAHYAMAATALEKGKHVFVEKPLCQTAEQLRALHDLWKRAGGRLKLQSNLVLRTAPLYHWLKGKIAAGALGEIYAVDADYLYGRIEKITEGWRSRVENYSAMQGGGVHMIDLALWLTGQRPRSVMTTGNQIATRGSAFRYKDFMAATLDFPSGLVARVTANFGCVHRHQHGLRIYGTKGTFLYDDAGARLHTSRDPAVAPVVVNEAPKPSSKGELISAFISAILQNTPLDTQTDFDVMSILIASDQSLATRESKEINYL